MLVLHLALTAQLEVAVGITMRKSAEGNSLPQPFPQPLHQDLLVMLLG